MEQLKNIKNYIDNLDQQQFKRYIIIFFTILTLIIGLILFFYFRSISTLETKIATINSKRREIRELLARYELVKKQQKSVDQLLEKQQDFKIVDFFEGILKKLQLNGAQMQEPQTTSESILDGYTERTLYGNLSNLNMKNLADILNAIEQEERIYTKEIEIDRSTTKPNAINAKIVIATLDKETKELEE